MPQTRPDTVRATAAVPPPARAQTRTANVLGALPKSAKRAIQEICNGEDEECGARAVRDFGRACRAKSPKVVKRVTDDVDEPLVYFDFHAEHWIHLRTTDPIESSFGRAADEGHQGRRQPGESPSPWSSS
ncbi:hypothetical protein GCM10010433_62590 [Streptomyces pulveraceus]|uniref:Uncharacterized protein n=1 Tax=Streptomyces pulveraceus TaxID=68258 RepID=A0ABW1GWU3_9ACTN